MLFFKRTDACFHTAGDCAISVELGNEISLKVNAKVRALQQLIKEYQIPGVVETVPTYTCLMIHYRPDIITYGKLVRRLKKLLKSLGEESLSTERVVEIPIMYGGEKGPDLEACAEMEGISTEELIRIHSQPLYYSYMLGFAPGHAYMARFEKPFSFKRRESPRIRIPGGSVVAAENLSNLIPFDQPCGWNIIGHTPVKLFDYSKESPCQVNAGDWVRFVPVGEDEYGQIMESVERGEYECKTYLKEKNNEPIY